MKSIWEDRLVELEEMLTNGTTLEEAGNYYNVSRERIRQIVKKYMPYLEKKDFGAGKRVVTRLAKRKEDIKKRYNRLSYQNLSDLERAQAAFFTRKRQNAKWGKWDWELDMSDFEWPTHCPVLGIELDWFSDKTVENSPSIDRLDSNKGYVKGNVCIMSWRANRIKNDGTKEEHQLIVDFLSSKGL